VRIFHLQDRGKLLDTPTFVNRFKKENSNQSETEVSIYEPTLLVIKRNSQTDAQAEN
jgi:hypothetical protein